MEDSVLHWPCDGQLELLEGVEEDQVVQLEEIIRTGSVCGFLGCLPFFGRRWKPKKSLGRACQQYISVYILLYDERIRQSNADMLTVTFQRFQEAR
jgi:hypothetical protein